MCNVFALTHFVSRLATHWQDSIKDIDTYAYVFLVFMKGKLAFFSRKLIKLENEMRL